MKNHKYRYRLLFVCVIISILFIKSFKSQAQVRVTVGAKTWYTTWNIPIEHVEGEFQSNFSWAVLVGPYINIRFGKFGTTLSYSNTVKAFYSTSRNPGYIYYGLNQNWDVSREDINLFFNYTIISELTMFANMKLMKYHSYSKGTYIDSSQWKFEEHFTVTGFGGGVQIAVPFSGDSPFYTFSSIGVVYNSSKSNMRSGETTELLFILDSGVGYRIMPTSFGVTFGIRVEGGAQTDVIIGPVANIFYTF